MSYTVSRTDLLKAVALLQYASSRLAQSPQQRDVQRAFTMKQLINKFNRKFQQHNETNSNKKKNSL